MLGRLVWLLALSVRVCFVRGQTAEEIALEAEALTFELERGCGLGRSGGPRIGMSVTGFFPQGGSQYREMLWAALKNLPGNVAYLGGNFSICVAADDGEAESIYGIYHHFIWEERYDVVLGPSNGKFNDMVRHMVQEAGTAPNGTTFGTRLILWAQENESYNLEGDVEEDNPMGRIIFHYDQAFVRQEQTGVRRLSEPLLCSESVRDVDLTLRNPRADLPVLDLTFDHRYNMLGLMYELQPLASSLAFVYVVPDPLYWAEKQDCERVKEFAVELGFHTIEQNFSVEDPYPAMEWARRDTTDVVIWCASDQHYEFLYTIVKGVSWQPKLIVASRAHALHTVSEDVPTFVMNYNVEPSFWPSVEELEAWPQYGQWYARQVQQHGRPPSLMEHQLNAALQIAETLYSSNYLIRQYPDSNLWDFETQDVLTSYGRIRFTKDGQRNGTCGFPSVKQFLPYPTFPNMTEADVARRFYDSLERYMAPNASGEKGILIDGNPVTRLQYPQPSLWQKELEVFPCPDGCEVKIVKCVPCPRGTYRSSDDLRCRPCPPGTFADIPGLTVCSPCPSYAECLSVYDEPQAQPGFYKVQLHKPNIPDPNNLSDPGWTQYCQISSTAFTSAREGGSLERFNIADCNPPGLCLGGNRCYGHNTGHMCHSCDKGFSRRHKFVDLRECRPCLSKSAVLWQLTQCALFLIVIACSILILASWELRRSDSVKAPLILALVTHLHVRGALQEYISEDPDEVSEHAWHIYLSMILVRPFDLSFTDCLLDTTDPLEVNAALLDAALVSYIIGLVFAFSLGPCYLLCQSLAGIVRRVLEGRKRVRPRSQKQRSRRMNTQQVSELVDQQRDRDKVFATEAEKRYMLMYEAIEVKLCLLDSLRRCLVWTLVYYPILVRQLAQPFICRVSAADQQKKMMAAPSVACDDPGFENLRSRSLGMLIAFGLGVPVTICLALFAETSDFYTISKRRLVGLLVSGYKKHYWFWESVKVLRTFAVVVCGIVPDPLTRRGVVLCIFLSLTFATSVFEPHTRHFRGALPRAEVSSLVCLSIMIISGWVEASLSIIQKNIPEGTWVLSSILWTKWICLMVEKYGDVFFFFLTARSLFFSLIALPVHIASRTGVAFGRHIRGLLVAMRWHYALHSVGVVTETFVRPGTRRMQTYLWVGSLGFTERRVMKLGILEVLQVAVKHHVKFHPMLIVNSLDQAAVRAGMARNAIQLRRQQEQDQGVLASIMKKALSDTVTPTVGNARPGGSSASLGGSSDGGMGDSSDTVSSMDPDGYFTVDELYAAIQDVIMDILDRHPKLQSVATVAPLALDQERRRELADEQLEGRFRRPKKQETHRDEDEVYFEQLLLEHEGHLRRQRLLLAKHAKTSAEATLAPETEESEISQMTRSAARQVERMCTDTERWLKEARDLREALAERRADIKALHRRLGHKGFYELEGARPLSKAPDRSVGDYGDPSASLAGPEATEEEDEEDVILQLLGPHALPPSSTPEPRTELLSPRSRELTFAGLHLRALELHPEPQPGHPQVLAVVDGTVTPSERVEANESQAPPQASLSGSSRMQSQAQAVPESETHVVPGGQVAQGLDEEAEESAALPPFQDARPQEIPPASSAGSARSLRVPGTPSGSSTSSVTRRRKPIWSPKVHLGVAPIPEEGQRPVDSDALPVHNSLGSLRPGSSTLASGQSTPLSELSSGTEDLLPAAVSALSSSWNQSVWATPEARAAAAVQEAQRSTSPTRAKVPPLPLR